MAEWNGSFVGEADIAYGKGLCDVAVWRETRMTAKFRTRALWAGGAIALISIGALMGFPFATIYRVGCAVACLGLIGHIALDNPAERWPRIGVAAAAVVNFCLFFTPIFDRPPSRGELMFFAVPDAIILLVARLATFAVRDDHDRAQRQVVILGLVVAVALCVMQFSLTLAALKGGHR